MRQLVSTALVALVVSLATGFTVGAVAQQPIEQPGSGPAVTTAGVNADTVDGKHAVGAKATIAKRRNKLVAADKTGFLPSNVVKPRWNLLTGKPAFLADDQIGWNELQGIPAGFADGADDAGVTKIRLGTYQVAQEVPAGGWHFIDVPCPTGWKATGGGFFNVPPSAHVDASEPVDQNTAWHFEVTTAAGVGSHLITVKVICMTTEPASGLGTAKVRAVRGK